MMCSGISIMGVRVACWYWVVLEVCRLDVARVLVLVLVVVVVVVVGSS